jgi:hypothetical protein
MRMRSSVSAENGWRDQQEEHDDEQENMEDLV